MKRLLNIFLIVGILSLQLAEYASAATSDTFQITVTCKFVSIILKDNAGTSDYTTWALGSKALNTASTMTQAEGIKVVNTSNATTDISAWVSTQAASWTNASAAGSDQYKLEMKSFDASQATPDLSTGTTIITGTATPGQTFKSSLAATTDQWAYCKFTTPTVDGSSGTGQTITITVLASAV